MRILNQLKINCDELGIVKSAAEDNYKVRDAYTIKDFIAENEKRLNNDKIHRI